VGEHPTGERKWTGLRCKHCGTENPGQHRFCGMCGRALEDSTPEAAAPRSAEARPEAQGHRDEPAVPAPAYTGGIFNLGAPPDKPGANLDYLLEDDEPRSHKGLVVGILALVLVAGLGYLRWRGELPWLRAGSSGAKNTAQTTDAQTGGAGGDQGAPASAPSSDAGQQSNNAAPAAVVTAPAAAPATLPSSAPAADPAPAARTGSAQTTTAASSAAANAAAETPAAESSPVGSPADAAPAGEQAAAPPAAAGDQSAPAPPATTAAATATPPAKPKVKPKPAPPTRPEDSVAMGERYLYGRGVPQDCTRGLRYVKPAADQSIPKAMITMGALYATGHCLSRDLPTAYRYFALALRKDPENGALKQNAEMVWGQMTASERQQAIRMTQ
jgi:TPR repeat protein